MYTKYNVHVHIPEGKLEVISLKVPHQWSQPTQKGKEKELDLTSAAA